MIIGCPAAIDYYQGRYAWRHEPRGQLPRPGPVGFQIAKVLFAPGKASNAGGVATSGLEMSQNSMRMSWSREEVDKHLHGIMVNIHNACVTAAKEAGMPGNYVAGAIWPASRKSPKP